jgi:hypothetical protein
MKAGAGFVAGLTGKLLRMHLNVFTDFYAAKRFNMKNSLLQRNLAPAAAVG